MNLAYVRWAVRGALVLGVAASVIANVLHAVDNVISQTIAAWPPLALLITVELIARVPVHRMWLAVVRLVSVAVLAGIAAWVSYWHMVGVAVRYGESGLSPYLLPLTVDGLIVVASICLVELSGRPVNVDGVDSDPDNALDKTPTAPRQDPDNHSDKELDTAEAVGVDSKVDRTPVQVDSPGGQVDSEPLTPAALKVIAAHTKWPQATDAKLADLAGVSTKSVQRYRPKSTSGQVNGHAPQLTTTP